MRRLNYRIRSNTGRLHAVRRRKPGRCFTTVCKPFRLRCLYSENRRDRVQSCPSRNCTVIQILYSLAHAWYPNSELTFRRATSNPRTHILTLPHLHTHNLIFTLSHLPNTRNHTHPPTMLGFQLDDRLDLNKRKRLSKRNLPIFFKFEPI